MSKGTLVFCVRSFGSVAPAAQRSGSGTADSRRPQRNVGSADRVIPDPCVLQLGAAEQLSGGFSLQQSRDRALPRPERSSQQRSASTQR